MIQYRVKSSNGSFLCTWKENTEKRGWGEGGDYRILMRARYDLVQSQVADRFYIRGKRTLRRGGGGRGEITEF